jgi:hypothetical protein
VYGDLSEKNQSSVPTTARLAPKTLLYWGYFALAVLYAYVSWTSPGYDDEFVNISLIEHLGAGALRWVQSTDVHPPGSYLLNWLGYSLTHDWRAVRLLSAVFCTASIIYAIETMRRRTGVRSAARLFVLLGLNPALLLWCTGLRWYAYFVPVLILTCVTPKASGLRYWAKLVGGLVLLGYIGYAVFVIAPAVILSYWYESRETLTSKARSLLILGPIGVGVYAPQLHVFLTVHVHSGSQITSLFRSLVGFYVAQISNQGVFPLSLPGIVGALGTGGLMFIVVAQRNGNARAPNFRAYALASALSVVSGIAGRFRNLVLISPLQATWLAAASVLRWRVLAAATFCMVAVANCWGIANVALHAGTTKNSWNLPVSAAIDAIERHRAECGGDVVVFAHEPMLAYHLAHAGYPVVYAGSPVVNPNAEPTSGSAVPSGSHRCAAILRTFRGALDSDRYAQMGREIESIMAVQKDSTLLGRDPTYARKRLLDPDYPEFAIEVIFLVGPRNLEVMRAWLPE